MQVVVYLGNGVVSEKSTQPSLPVEYVIAFSGRIVGKAANGMHTPDFRSVIPNDTAHAHQTASVIPLAVGTLLYSVVNPP